MRFIMAVVGATVVLFIWQTFANLVAPWSELTVRPFVDEAGVREALLAGADQSGMYFLPLTEPEAAADSPTMFVAVRRDGLVSTAYAIAGQILADLVALSLAALGLRSIAMPSMGRRTLAVTTVGLIGWIVGSLPHALWWGVSATFVGIELVNTVVGWTLAGLVLASGALGLQPLHASGNEHG